MDKIFNSTIIITLFSTSMYAANTDIKNGNLYVDDSPFFPIGVYYEELISPHTQGNGYEELQEAGFNLICLQFGWKIGESNWTSRDVISTWLSGPDLGYWNPFTCWDVLHQAHLHNLFILSDMVMFNPDDGKCWHPSCRFPWSVTQATRMDCVYNLIDNPDYGSHDSTAFLGWSSWDEAFWNLAYDYTPDRRDEMYASPLKSMYDEIHRRDPHHIVYMNHCYAHPYAYYWNRTGKNCHPEPPPNDPLDQFITDCSQFSSAADVISADPYPFYFTFANSRRTWLFDNPELSIVGDYAKLLVEKVVEKSKPVWIVLEGHLSANGSGFQIAPSYDSIRFESNVAVANGVKGLLYYQWNTHPADYNTNDLWNQNENWWNRIKQYVHDELREMGPALAPLVWDTTARIASNPWTDGVRYVNKIQIDDPGKTKLELGFFKGDITNPGDLSRDYIYALTNQSNIYLTF